MGRRGEAVGHQFCHFWHHQHLSNEITTLNIQHQHSTKYKMVFLRSCCICVSLRTGTLIIAILGIILGAILIAPMSVFLEYHSFYIATFVTSGRDTAKLDDAEVPKMEFFSKILFSILLSLDVIYILSCVLLLVGVTAVKHIMMIPWLIYVFSALTSHLTLVLAFMISLADYASVAVFLGSSPSLVVITYLWLVVYSASKMIKKQEISARGPKSETVGAQSASHSSLSSLKENISRAIRGTPPPPYEAVTTKSSPRQKTSSEEKSGSVTSCSSLVDILHFKSEQSERSSQSNSRRSSDGETSTKPASPVTLLRKRSAGVNSDLLVFSDTGKPSLEPPPDTGATRKVSPQVLKASKSQSQLCTTRMESPSVLPKSQSSMISSFSPDVLIQFNSKPVEETSELSDETSSMSSTSLSLSENKNI